MFRLLNPAAFSAAAIAIAWIGAHVDTFVLPMDETSAHALGSPEFAYGIVLGTRLVVTAVACVIFTVTLLVTGSRKPRSGSGVLRAVAYGAGFSAVVSVLGELVKQPSAFAFQFCCRGYGRSVHVQRTHSRELFQFGRGPDMDYDPVCFDLRSLDQDADCRVVKFDHEEILCNDRIVEVREVAPSFRTLVRLAIDDARVERAVGALHGSELVRAAGRIAELTNAERGYLVEAFQREPDVLKLRQAIAAVRTTKALLTVPLLAAGLDALEPAVWTDALDGLLGVSTPELAQLLRSARARAIEFVQTYGNPLSREIVGALSDKLVALAAAKVQAIDAALKKLGDSA